MKIEQTSNIWTMLLLLTALFLMLSAAMDCPYPEEVYPCRCMERVSRWLFCGGPNLTIPEIQRAVKAMGDDEFILKVKNANLEKIGGDFFDGGMFSEVHFEDCYIKSIDTSSDLVEFPMPKMIGVLDIFNSLHGNIEINLFSLGTMSQLTLSNNVIKHLEIDWPIQPLPLMAMHLSNNSIESVNEDAFAALSFLNVLDMSRNRLQTLGNNLKPVNPQSLTRLDFSHNRISSISKYYFFNMMGLQSVSLSYNYIQIIDEKTWINVWPQLTYINLQENPLRCGPEIKWIRGKQPKIVLGICSRNLTDVIKENNPTESNLPEMIRRSFLLGQRERRREVKKSAN